MCTTDMFTKLYQTIFLIRDNGAAIKRYDTREDEEKTQGRNVVCQHWLYIYVFSHYMFYDDHIIPTINFHCSHIVICLLILSSDCLTFLNLSKLLTHKLHQLFTHSICILEFVLHHQCSKHSWCLNCVAVCRSLLLLCYTLGTVTCFILCYSHVFCSRTFSMPFQVTQIKRHHLHQKFHRLRLDI